MASHKLIECIKIDFLADASIVEIGSARESSGEESSTFFYSALSKKVNAEFYSVDFSPQSRAMAAEVVGGNAVLSDGTAFLKVYNTYSQRKIALLYLDNFDVVYNDKHKQSLLKRVGSVYDDNNEVITNERSAAVHLEQIKAAQPFLAIKNVVIVDDTKLTEDGWWGKGALVVPFLLESGYKIAAQSEDGLLLSNF